MKYECTTHRYRGDHLPCPWPEHGTPPEVRLPKYTDDAFLLPVEGEAVTEPEPVGVLVFRREMVRVGDHRSIGGCCTVYRWMSVDESAEKRTVPAWRVT